MKKLFLLPLTLVLMLGCSRECPTVKISGYLENYDTPMIAIEQIRLFERMDIRNVQTFDDFMDIQNRVMVYSAVVERNTAIFNSVRSGDYTLFATFSPSGQWRFTYALKNISVGRNDQHIRIVFSADDVGGILVLR